MFQDLLDGLLNAKWLQEMLSFIIEIIMVIVQIVLIPISYWIKTMFPEIDQMLATIPYIFDNASTYLAWTFSAFAIPPLIITGMILYYGYILVTPLILWGIKLGIKWYRELR